MTVFNSILRHDLIIDNTVIIFISSRLYHTAVLLQNVTLITHHSMLKLVLAICQLFCLIHSHDQGVLNVLLSTILLAKSCHYFQEPCLAATYCHAINSVYFKVWNPSSFQVICSSDFDLLLTTLIRTTTNLIAQ